MSQHVTFMTIDDAGHYSPEQRAAIVAAYPEHEREARAKGIPVLGSGRIFPVAEELIACEPFRLPRWWPRIGALDFGWDHPSAAIELAWETEADVVYVTYTHQPSQEVRGLHRHRIGGTFEGSDWAMVESAVATPGQTGVDDIWLFVKRTIGGVTKRYIEVMQAPFEYGQLVDAFQVDCGLTYSGAPVNVVSGLGHLNGEKVDVLADGKVFRGLTVASGQVTLPGDATAAKWQVGLPFQAQADTLELDVGGQDGSLIGHDLSPAEFIAQQRRAEQEGEAEKGRGPKLRLLQRRRNIFPACVDFFPRAFSVEFFQIEMGVGVASDCVSSLRDHSHKGRIRHGLRADHQECCLDAGIVQRAQNGFGMFWDRPIIEGQY